MEALEAILTRRSVPPVKMGPPGPDETQLRHILEAAAAAPDHGLLRPWRFLVIRSEGRRRLGELFVAAAQAEIADVSAQEIEKQRMGPLRAPVIVVVVARVDPDHPKIPEMEQIASAAAATQNLLLAAHALGFAAKWATGKPAYSREVMAGLGLNASEQIMALVYLGSYAAEHNMPPRAGLDGLVSEWPSAS